MKRTLYALVPWMVLASAAYGQVRSADVVYTFSNTIPVRAYKLADECFVPIEATSAWEWKVEAHGDQVAVVAEGRTVTESLRTFSGDRCLPLRKTVKDLGGQSTWILGTDTLEVWSDLPKLTLRDGKLSVSSPLGFRASTLVLANPSRVIVDLNGVKLSPSTKLDVDDNVKVTQFGPRSVRVVMETEDTDEIQRSDGRTTREMTLNLNGGKRAPVRTVEPPVRPTQPAVGRPTPTVTQVVPGDPIVLPLAVDIEGDSATLLNIRLSGVKNVSVNKPDPDTVEVRLEGVNGVLPADFRLDTESVTSTAVRQDGSATVLSLSLSRPMAPEVWMDGSGVQIQLVKPIVGNGRLAGKVIVVDPGHGGHDHGARYGGVAEKDVNLAIGRLIAAELAANGATVVMTRKTDVFIPLSERGRIAARNRADFFISNHINSNATPNSQSGSITFYHKGRTTGKLLAECIQTEIAKVNNLPNIGAWSDGRLYQSGLAVLRETSMPGVLLELGFVNNSRDRARIQEHDFQVAIAKAVVRGIKVFLGDE